MKTNDTKKKRKPGVTLRTCSGSPAEAPPLSRGQGDEDDESRCEAALLLVASDPQDLQAVVVADGDPVGLRGRPLHVVDLPFGRVGQDGVLDGARHLLDVPDQGLVVVRCGEDETTRQEQKQEEPWRRKKIINRLVE